MLPLGLASFEERGINGILLLQDGTNDSLAD